jgi:hypothetical protein
MIRDLLLKKLIDATVKEIRTILKEKPVTDTGGIVRR